MTESSTSTHTADLPPAATQWLREASQALGRNQIDFAIQSLTRVLALAPECADAHRLMGIAFLISGDRQKSISHLQRALAVRPDDSTLNMNLGSALFELGDVDAGLAHLQRACELAPRSASTWYNYGKALQFSARIEQAHDILKHAVAIDPGYAKARNTLASVLSSLGDTPAAVAMYRDTLKQQQSDSSETWFGLANLKTERFSREDIAELQRQLGSDLPDGSRILLGFTLAKAMEDQADYALAFDVLREANALKRRYVHWDREEERTRVDAIANTFSGAMPAPLDATLGREVIFVACLPRSGSTLTEQILGAHPQIEAADEIETLPEILQEESRRRGQPFPAWVPSATAEDWQRLGKDYLARTRRWHRQGLRFTDKNPSNWAYVGAALAMLPGARVVNSRRDPLETCFACYRQLFGNSSVDYSYDLDDLVDYYAGYVRLSGLWKQRFPQQCFDFEYELLQADAEAQIRRLLDFCEVPFDPVCLDFHQSSRTVLTISAAQVRQPLRLDTARSARYGSKLDPLRARLRAAGVLPAG
ncbi:tetratricopeptide repeat-containing sulfotransferase family protein [Frateuria terrea]|uniref:Tetratricopeptide repeat-containing protein n=1 Tax=Frateuria terrea TaxID=529704 RepID=A0A1H6ZEU2_9GAMM|nr:tetratricopeptide repeat-containing sulfotransferase family protein [Frateuria terrea]SEJ51226.1 Tetratricopeptide repeat-containing protein [Frateuria terrea]SFP79296.1 Tetratricopeptide repeat-containing protein [Frateuria terrea]